MFIYYVMSRSPKSQSKHDKLVGEIARDYERKGYLVDADIKGYSKPGTIGGYRPDVVARKGTERKIVEVETPDSSKSKRDLGQQAAFRQAANRSVNTTFNKRIAR